MKKGFLLISCFAAFSLNIYAQCTPNAPTGNPGVTPAPSAVTCIERGKPYSITMYLENFSFISSPLGNIVMNWARIDSLKNFPCGITWSANKTTFNAGETGCITVSGTTNDPVGQYPLLIFMTVSLNVPGFGNIEQGGEIGTLLTQLQQLGVNLGIDLGYYSRVIETGNPCPAIDYSPTANNLTSSGTGSNNACPAASLSVTITGNAAVCAGSSTMLTASVSNASGTVSYAWSTGATSQSVTVSPTTTTTYSVTVTDQNGSATASKTVTVNQAPTASFSVNVTGSNASVTNTTTGGATSYNWDFGDGTTPQSGQNPPIHTYATSGTYTITLIASNSCGSDTAAQTVNIGVSSVRGPENTIGLTVSPNPGTGLFTLSFHQNSLEEITISIFDLSGKQLYYAVMPGSEITNRQLDLRFLNKGVYTLRVDSPEGSGLQRIVLY
ncbi:MAG: hypothetical protein KatS3mg031_1313 [Chitinophagales bacterium]|nr:MAG: hypothetical protein KatS3mg031_1313 [Chitinophagales bacterium]